MRFWRIVNTFITLMIVISLWRWLELTIYGAIETRVVDDIICLVMVPFFYWTSAYFSEKKGQRSQKERESQ